MGQYKVPQNVEAEDKIIGPLTFKQFIYALMGAGWGLLSFAIFKSVPALMIIIGGPPTILFMLLAFYSRDGQNFEQLLIALVGFFANPRRRTWLKEEVVETFHVTPRAVVAEQTQRDSSEVRSELEKLGNLIDSRGWNQPMGPELQPTMPVYTANDRLVQPTAPAPQPGAAQPEANVDMLDLHNSPLAQNLAALINEAAADVREEAIQQMKTRATTAATQPAPSVPAQSISGVTTPAPSNIIRLATESDDLTVSQLAATATRVAPGQLAEGQAVNLRNGNSVR